MAKKTNARLTTKSALNSAMGGSDISNEKKTFYKQMYNFFFEDGLNEVKSFTDYNSHLSVEVYCSSFGSNKTVTVTTYSKQKHKMLCSETVSLVTLRFTDGAKTYLKISGKGHKKSILSDLSTYYVGNSKSWKLDGVERHGFEIVQKGYYFWPFSKRTECVKLFAAGEVCGYQMRKGRTKYVFGMEVAEKFC